MTTSTGDRLVARLAEHIPKEDADDLLPGTRGIYRAARKGFAPEIYQ